MSTFKFFKHHNGISSFAVVGLEKVNDGQQLISWNEGTARFRDIYEKAVASGVRKALQWHSPSKSAGAQAFVITEFIELLVDTKEDAVECAAIGAVWKELGNDPNDIVFEWVGNWRAKLRE